MNYFYRFKILFLVVNIFAASCSAAGNANKQLTDLSLSLQALKTKLASLAVSLSSLQPTYPPQKSHYIQPERVFGSIYAKKPTIVHTPPHCSYDNTPDNQEGIFIYDVVVLTQKAPWSAWSNDPAVQQLLKDIGKPNAPSTYLLQHFGCDFHSIKNAIYLSKLLSYPPQNFDQKENHLIENFQKPLKLMKHFEFTKNGKKSWGTSWIERRKQSPPPGQSYAQNATPLDLIYTPTGLPVDLEALRDNISQNKISTPKFSPNYMQNTFILESQMGITGEPYLTGNLEKDNQWLTENDVKKLIQIAQLFKKEKSIVIPIIWSYAQLYGNRHWITLILNKFSDIEELLLADSWRTTKAYNKYLTSLLIAWIKKPEEMVKKYIALNGSSEKFKQEIKNLMDQESDKTLADTQKILDHLKTKILTNGQSDEAKNIYHIKVVPQYNCIYPDFSCGYHALVNAINLSKLWEGKRQTLPDNQEYISAFNQRINQWKQYIENSADAFGDKYNWQANGGDLSTTYLDFIKNFDTDIKELIANKEIIYFPYSSSLYNISNLKAEENIEPDFIPCLENFYTKDSALLFWTLGLAEHYYLLCAAKRHGQIYFIFCDSLNKPNLISSEQTIIKKICDTIKGNITIAQLFTNTYLEQNQLCDFTDYGTIITFHKTIQDEILYKYKNPKYQMKWSDIDENLRKSYLNKITTILQTSYSGQQKPAENYNNIPANEEQKRILRLLFVLRDFFDHGGPLDN
ncbi:hypothetical protein IPF37_03115 [bacterium]|nr:MAG: hypothetical protein IPF37_03115 [bacterium]